MSLSPQVRQARNITVSIHPVHHHFYFESVLLGGKLSINSGFLLFLGVASKSCGGVREEMLGNQQSGS
jgi:hypothetical protein